VALKLVLGDEAGEATVAVEDNTVLDKVQGHEEHLLGTAVAFGLLLGMKNTAGVALDKSVVLDQVGLESGLLDVLGRTVRALELLFEVLALNMTLVVLSSFKLL